MVLNSPLVLLTRASPCLRSTVKFTPAVLSEQSAALSSSPLSLKVKVPNSVIPSASNSHSNYNLFAHLYTNSKKFLTLPLSANQAFFSLLRRFPQNLPQNATQLLRINLRINLIPKVPVCVGLKVPTETDSR